MSARHSPIFMILNVRVRFKFRKEGNVLFNDALNTFYLSLKVVTYIIYYYMASEDLSLGIRS